MNAWPCLFCRFLLLSVFSASLAAGQGLVYVDGDDDYTAGHFGPNANLAPASAFNQSTLAPDNLWGYRGGTGYDGFVWESSGVSGPEDAPEFTQTIRNLVAGASYKVYAVYWSTAENWNIRTGTSSGALTLYDRAGVLPDATAGLLAESAIWSTPPRINGVVTFSQSGRTAYLGYAGTVVADPSGRAVVYMDDYPGSASTRSSFDGVAFQSAVFNATLDVSIDRGTGLLTLANHTGGDLAFSSLSITSASQSLIPDNWLSLTETGNLDSDPWEITAPAGLPWPCLTETLSERELPGALEVGAILTHGGSVGLGNIWHTSGTEDVRVSVTLTSGRTLDLAANFTGTSLPPGDFDGDGDVDGTDFLRWQREPGVGSLATWQSNYGVPLVASAGAVPEIVSPWLFGLLAVGWAAAQRTIC